MRLLCFGCGFGRRALIQVDWEGGFVGDRWGGRGSSEMGSG